ncbi:MAG: PspC domain-containing protein [Limosilactobacillus sp.]|uniref:PspC domain-containing protein n=1 Tax=Limosilactobacillus sp. TaxID=2773925 RepID=UPI002707A339|nr:PspC domain-containing protein [Limosilactobacillus sp.]
MREDRHKKLTRSSSDKMVAGVLGGFGQYLGWSANLLRISYVIFTIISGVVPGVLIYLITVLIMPPDPNDTSLFGLFQTLANMQKHAGEGDQSHSRRTLTDVEEQDIKRNGRD